MGEKRKDWRALWTEAVDDAEAIAHMLQQLPGDSRRDPLPPLELESLGRVVAKLPAKASGVGALTPRDLHRAPSQGRVKFLELLNHVEHEGVWPAQLLSTDCALLPKPK
eukprot:237036-Pyramimonas_sp.AAC.1